MIPAEYYQDIYYFLVAVFGFISINRFNIYIHRSDDNVSSVLVMLVFVLFLGTRPNSYVFADSYFYYDLYERSYGYFEFDWDTTNLLFDNLENYLASIRLDPTIHYVLFALIYYGCILIACYKLFKGHSTFMFLCYCAAFSTYSYCINGYKAGSAAAIFLVALAYRDNWKVSIPLVFISWGFHHSMQLPVLAYFITMFYSKPKYFYYLWYVCAIISLLHIHYFQDLFSGLTDEKGSNYLRISNIGNDWGGNGTGFRFDFWIYSAMPVFVGWWTINKFKINDVFYNKLLCMYLITNSAWLLCIYASFTNRIAYLSWFMYPFVLVYPLFNGILGEKRNDFIRKTVSLHLLFTLFMYVIYYGF